jgi:hypothetical protein
MKKYSETEDYIIDESREISVGQTPHWSHKILTAFPAFRHKDYRLFFIGQLISLSGTWLQMVAQGILV